MPRKNTFRRLLNRNSQLVLFSGVSVLCLVFTIVLATQVFFRLDSYATARSDNVPWTMAQLKVDQLKLLDALQSVDPDTPRTLTMLNRRLDAFYSRQSALMSGPSYSDIRQEPRVQEALRKIAGTVAELDRVIIENPGTIIANRPALEKQIRSLNGDISTLNKISIAQDTRIRETDRRALITKLAQVTWLSVLLLVALLSLTVLLWRLYRLYRKRALENRSTLNRLATILNTSQDAVLVVNEAGEILDTNPAANAMFFGDTPSQGRGPVHHHLLRKQPDGSLMPVDGARLMKSCEDGPNLCANLVAQSAQGAQFPVELSADVAWRGGHPVVICFIRNITRRLADQAEILAARDIALATERDKARFLAMVSHEMRTPLNGMIGALDLLQDTPLTPGQQGYIRLMQSSGELLQNQVSDALDIVRAHKGELRLTRDAFDLPTLLDDLVQARQPVALERGNRVVLHPPQPAIGSVTGDRARLHQVLLNLIDNADKFTRDGRIEITAEAQGDDLIAFRISDTGIGIAPKDQDRIFEDFVRLDTPGSETVEGTGLGLGIVRHLVRLMDGELSVDSTPGKGSVFSVCLPLPRADTPLTANDVLPPETHPCPSKRVLVVEDNETNLLLLRDMLTRDGHHVTIARNGKDGVEAAKASRFDLILMDINMPVMDGRQAARRIRQSGTGSALARILALTAFDSVESADWGEFDDVLHKPIRLALLRHALRGEALPAAAHTSSGPLDHARLDELRTAFSDQRVDALLDGLTREAEALIGDLPSELPEDTVAFIDQLHQLAGLAATLGALPLQAGLNRVEDNLNMGKADEAMRAINALPGLWHAAQDEITQLRRAA